MSTTEATPTSAAIERAKNTPDAMIDRYRGDFAMVLPAHIKPDQWVRLSMGVMRQNKDLARVAQSNPGSFMAALFDCARLGLVIGETYHLVAFGNEITGIPDYKGLIELIYRAGVVATVKAEVVYEKDDFDYDPGVQDRPTHKPAGGWFADRGEMIGGYAYGIMKDGSVSRVVIMSKAEIEQHKAVSRSARSSSAPWSKWPKSMWLKTLVKELQKWVPSSAEYMQEAMKAQAGLATAAPDLPLTLTPDFDERADPNEPPPFVTGSDDDEVAEGEIVDEPDAPAGDPMTQPQSKALHSLLKVPEDERHAELSRLLGRPITSAKEITKDEASRLIDQLQEGGADD